MSTLPTRPVVRREPSLLIVLSQEDLLFRRALRQTFLCPSITWVNTAQAALTALEGLLPISSAICMVAELSLPDASGAELLKSARALDPSERLRFVFISERCSPDQETTPRAWGADLYLLKPTQYSDLLEMSRTIGSLLATADQDFQRRWPNPSLGNP